MTTFSFRAILKKHNDSAEQIAEKLYPLYDDITVSSSEDLVCVAFVREADSFANLLRSARQQLGEAGYQIARVEIDGQDFPAFEGTASDHPHTTMDDTRAD